MNKKENIYFSYKSLDRRERIKKVSREDRFIQVENLIKRIGSFNIGKENILDYEKSYNSCIYGLNSIIKYEKKNKKDISGHLLLRNRLRAHYIPIKKTLSSMKENEGSVFKRIFSKNILIVYNNTDLIESELLYNNIIVKFRFYGLVKHLTYYEHQNRKFIFYASFEKPLSIVSRTFLYFNGKIPDISRFCLLNILNVLETLVIDSDKITKIFKGN